MKPTLSVQLTLDQQRLAHLLEHRLVCIEDLNCTDPETKSKLKSLVLQNALKGQTSFK